MSDKGQEAGQRDKDKRQGRETRTRGRAERQGQETGHRDKDNRQGRETKDNTRDLKDKRVQKYRIFSQKEANHDMLLKKEFFS
jgi:hypothetical protein